MTTPLQSAGPAEQGPPARSGRSELARVWAKALSTTAYVLSTRRDVERLLRDLLDGLFESVTADRFSPGPAREVGVRLVAEDFTTEQSLSHTVEVLGQALPVHPELQNVDRLASKVVSVRGALSACFAAALRGRTLDQQEQVKRGIAVHEGGGSSTGGNPGTSGGAGNRTTDPAELLRAAPPCTGSRTTASTSGACSIRTATPTIERTAGWVTGRWSDSTRCCAGTTRSVDSSPRGKPRRTCRYSRTWASRSRCSAAAERMPSPIWRTCPCWRWSWPADGPAGHHAGW